MKALLFLQQNLKRLIYAAGVALFIQGCQLNDSGEHQVVAPTSGGPKISSTEAIAFSAVAPILQSRCTRCHNSGTNDWSKEENIRRVALSGVLASRLQSRTMPMPQPGSPESSAISQEERQLLVSFANSLNSTSNKPVADGPEVVRSPFYAALNRCAGCHGINGFSVAPNIPNLASHDKMYFASRIQEFLLPKSETSPMKTVLEQVAKDFNLNYEIKDGETVVMSSEMTSFVDQLADFFSNQFVSPSPTVFEENAKKLSEQDKALFERGHKIVADNSCLACHLAQPQKPGEGFPMILGQKSDYLANRLQQFRSGQGGQMMPGIVEGLQLSDEDAKALVLYLSNTHPASIVQ